MLLVMLLAFSTVSIGASAAYSEYKSAPTSWNSFEEPVLSTTQRASQLLDYLDEVLAKENLYYDWAVIVIDLTSVDNALDTIDDIKGATSILGGDVKKLNFDSLDKTRRTTAGKTDLNILYNLLGFLNDNRSLVGKFLKGTLDLGLIDSFVNLDLSVYQELMDMLYKELVDRTTKICPAGWTADKILQKALDVYLLGGTAANGDIEPGLLPSLAGKMDITTNTVWQLIENAANAATKDLLAPLISNTLVPEVAKWQEKYPCDGWKHLDVSMISLDGYTWGKYDTKNGVFAELNHFIYYVLNQAWTGTPFWVDGGNDKLQSNLEALLKTLYAEFGTILLPASAELLSVEEVNAMNLQEICCYIGKQYLSSELPYIIWEDSEGNELPLENIGQLACYVIYSFTSEIISTNYMQDVEWGYEEYGSDYALTMLADIGAYYLNALVPINSGYGEGYEALLTKLANWALGDNAYGGFFKGCGVLSSDDVWTKIDKTVLKVLPLQQIFGGDIKGSKDFIQNRLFDSIFNLDFENLLEIFYKSDSSVLNKPVAEVVIWVVNNVLNVVVARNTQPAMIDTSLKTVDAIIQNNNLAGMAERLLAGLYEAGRYQYFWDSLLPILNPMLVDESNYAYNVMTPPSGYSIDTLEELTELAKSYEKILALPEDLLSTNNDDWHRSEDFELWRYDRLKDALKDANKVINGYPAAVTRVEEANTALAAANDALAAANAGGVAEEITAAQAQVTAAQNEVTNANANLASYNASKYANAAYELEYYAKKAFDAQNEASYANLEQIIYLADAKGYVKKNYSADVWANYEKAYNLANEVYDSDPVDSVTKLPVVKQSMVNYIRRNLIDAMRLLEVKLADMTELTTLIAQVKNTDLAGYSEKTVKAFEDALEEAVEMSGTLISIDRQDDVDSMVKKLKSAFEGLAAAVAVPVIKTLNSGVTVDETTKFIFGLSTLLSPEKLISSFVTSDENGTLEVESGKTVVGTGTKLTLLDKENNKVADYEAVIYGDANGDGIVDIMDAMCLDLYTVYQINYATNSAQWKALNLNNDSSVDAADAVILDGYANFENEINQQNPFAG